MLGALSSSIFRNSSEYGGLVVSTRTVYLESRPLGKSKVYRHCDVRGRVIHLGSMLDKRRSERLCTEKCMTEDKLVCPRVADKVLWSTYHYGEFTSLANVVPILAGRLPNGDKGYVARDVFVRYIIHSSDRAKAVPFLRLSVLRYAPDPYTRSNISGLPAATSEEGLDATGPYSWKFVRDLPRMRVIQDGKAKADGRYKGSGPIGIGADDDQRLTSNPYDVVDQKIGLEGIDDAISVSDKASFVTAREDILGT